MDPFPKMPLFAPLAEDQVRDLVAYRAKVLPRGSGGRPKRGEDEIARYERQQEKALDSLIPDVAEARQRVFEMMNALVRSGQWNRRALLDILYPPPAVAYPERLPNWARENFLWFDQQGQPAPGPSAALLVQHDLDPRRRKLPPPRPKPRLFSCWRWDMPQRTPSSYELPLVLFDGDNSVLKPQPEQGSSPYVLVTPWKGVQWDDPAWQVYDDVAARWVGDPTDLQLEQWVTPEERGALPSSNDGENREGRNVTQTLRLIVATRIPHGFPSIGPTSIG